MTHDIVSVQRPVGAGMPPRAAIFSLVCFIGSPRFCKGLGDGFGHVTHGRPYFMVTSLYSHALVGRVRKTTQERGLWLPILWVVTS